MALFIFAVIIAAAATSSLFIYIAKRISLCKGSLIAAISIMNVLFCTAFPLLFALVSGESGGGAAQTSDGAVLAGDTLPLRGLPAVFAVMALWAVFYAALVVWRVVLRSGSARFGVPLPVPIKDSVDTATNIDKMSNITDLRQDIGDGDVSMLLERAFECLGDGKPEDAAEYFYSAIEKRPPLGLEIQIAIQLGTIYCELGRSELTYEILTGYIDQYRDRLSDADMAALAAGVSMVESVVAGIGGDGYEKD